MKNIFSLKSAKKVTDEFHLSVDSMQGGEIKGWARDNNDLTAQMIIKITNGQDEAFVVADSYRPDVSRKGLHSDGRCGFNYDLGDSKEHKVKVSVVGRASQNRKSDAKLPIFFIHIPKTAGTSFKRAAEAYFGETAVARNYGPKSEETTTWIKDTLLKDGDYAKFIASIHQGGYSFYTGHVHALPASHVFPVSQTATFIRHPVQQVLSHFNHFKRWSGFEGEIEDFVTAPRFKNLQSRMLRNTPVNLIGFIGLTEDYDNSLKMFNESFAVNFKNLQVNVNNKKSLSNADESLIRLIEEHNQTDLRLYDHVQKLHQQRVNLYREGKAWCFGSVDIQTKEKIAGFAVWQKSNEPVALDLVSGNEIVQSTFATEHQPSLGRLQPLRSGFIGFTFDVSKLKNFEELKVVVRRTGQVLTTSM